MLDTSWASSQNTDGLIKNTCRLYRLSLWRILPFSTLIVALYHLIIFGQSYIPAPWLKYYKQSAMFGLIIIFCLMAMIFKTLDAIAKQAPLPLGALIHFTFTRFLSLLGAIISLLLLPAILLALGVAIYLFLGIQQVPALALLGWQCLVVGTIFASLVPKILAPILVISDEQEANAAVENSPRLVKHFYWRTLMLTLYSYLLWVFLIQLPSLITYYFPQLAQQISPLILQISADVLLVVIGPWSFACLLMQKYDLQIQKAKALLAQEKKTKSTA